MRWLVVLCVACGDNLVDEPPGSHGGTRLELYWYEMEGGGRELASGGLARSGIGPLAFDTERDEDCWVLEWADGGFRCTPGLVPWELNILERPRVVYADAGCTDLRGLATGAFEYFLRGEWLGEWFAIDGVVRGGTAADPGDYYERRDGTCVGPIAITGSVYLWTIQGSVPDTAFEPFERRVLASTRRIGHEALVGMDGTQVHLGFHDRELDVSCSLVHGVDDERCAPEAVEVGATFADARCTLPAVADAPADTRFAFERSYETDCTTVWELASPETMQVFEIDQGACVPTRTGTYRAGSPISLPAIDVSYGGGPGRVVDQLAAGASIGVFDTATQARCSRDFDWRSVDDPRCMPVPWNLATEFLDPACTQAVDVSMQPATACSRVARFATRDFDTHAEVGALAGELFTVIDERCVPLVPPDGYAYRTVGTDVPREAFARAELVRAR